MAIVLLVLITVGSPIVLVVYLNRVSRALHRMLLAAFARFGRCPSTACCAAWCIVQNKQRIESDQEFAAVLGPLHEAYQHSTPW